MDNIHFITDEKGHGRFYYQEGSVELGEMDIGIKDNFLTVYHTEVIPEAKGKGIAKSLLEAMVAHAREKKFQVTPLCPFVRTQFQRHPKLYEDLWTEK